jgi:hypothetical protein
VRDERDLPEWKQAGPTLILVNIMFRSAALLAILCATASAQPGQPSKARVAIIPGVAVNIGPTRVDALTQDLADALDTELLVDAVGGLEVRRQLRADLPADCVTQPACVQEVAKATGAQQLLFVVMVDAGGDAISVDTTWVDAATGKSEARPPISLTNTSDVDAKAKFQIAATSLLPDVPLRPHPKTVSVGIAGQVVAGTPRHITVPAMITAGVAVVGAGVWIGFGLDARSKYNGCQSAPCTQGRLDGIKHLDLAADLGWTIGLAAAIATGVLYVTSGEGTHLIVAPSEGTGAAVLAVGRF